jgi:hypothetical protein
MASSSSTPSNPLLA